MYHRHHVLLALLAVPRMQSQRRELGTPQQDSPTIMGMPGPSENHQLSMESSDLSMLASSQNLQPAVIRNRQGPSGLNSCYPCHLLGCNPGHIA